MTINSPFHEGEREIQRLADEQDNAAKLSSLIQKTLSPPALDFIQQQSVIWFGIEDQENFPWAFPLFGSPGFIHSDAGDVLDIDLGQMPGIHKKWLKYLQKGKFIGSLIIDLATRRRIRINGVIKNIRAHNLQIYIQQAYANCPRYINRREIQGKPDLCQFSFISSGIAINSQLKNIVEQCDTAFVASLGSNGADVSHRGGASGFLKYEYPNKIIVPDFKGNNMFNTLGNFWLHPFGGLTIIDFTNGHFLQLTGNINVFMHAEHPNINTGGSNRFWELIIRKWQLFQLENNPKWVNLDF